MCRQEVRDPKTCMLVIIDGRAIMFGLQIVIEKDRIVGVRLQKLFRFGNLTNDVELVAFEAFGKPLAAALVILQ